MKNKVTKERDIKDISLESIKTKKIKIET